MKPLTQAVTRLRAIEKSSFWQRASTLLTRRRSVLFVIIAVLLAKLFLLPWTAHPFDFWTFVLTFQRQLVFDWNVFEFWNKGNLLIILWYPLYALYLKVVIFLNSGVDFLPLLHLTFKIPFLLIDLWSAYLLFKIGSQVRDSTFGKTLFWLWFLNPIVFYVYGIHGHYELLVPFSIILLVWGSISGRLVSLATGIVILITTKYFALVFLPFVLLYLLAKKELRTIYLTGVLAVLGIAFSYLHLFANPLFFDQVVRSVLSLSSSGAATASSTLTLPALNIFSAINWPLYPDIPVNSLTNAILLPLASLNLKIVLLCYLLHLTLRVFAVWRKKEYSVHQFVFDLFLSISYLLIFLTNFQPHYISWLLPLIFILTSWRPTILAGGFVLVLSGFFYTLKNELGPITFYLNITPEDRLGPLGFDRVDSSTMYALGTAIIVSIVCMLYIARPGYKRKAPMFPLQSMYLVYGLAWLVIGVVSVRALLSAGISNMPSELQYMRSSNLHSGVIFATYEVKERTGESIIFSGQNTPGILLAEELTKLTPSQRERFSLYVVMRSPGQGKVLQEAAAQMLLNGCPLTPIGTVYYLPSRSDQPALGADIDCLQPGQTIVTAPSNFVDQRYDTTLYITTSAQDTIISKDQEERAHALAIVGIFYLLGIGLGLTLITRRYYMEGANA